MGISNFRARAIARHIHIPFGAHSKSEKRDERCRRAVQSEEVRTNNNARANYEANLPASARKFTPLFILASLIVRTSSLCTTRLHCSPRSGARRGEQMTGTEEEVRTSNDARANNEAILRASARKFASLLVLASLLDRTSSLCTTRLHRSPRSGARRAVQTEEVRMSNNSKILLKRICQRALAHSLHYFHCSLALLPSAPLACTARLAPERDERCRRAVQRDEVQTSTDATVNDKVNLQALACRFTSLVVLASLLVRTSSLCTARLHRSPRS